MGAGARQLRHIGEDAPRVLLAGERFLLLDALRLALQGHGYDVAVTGLDRAALDESLLAFAPRVVIVDVSRSSIEAALYTVRAIAQKTDSVVGICQESISVEASRVVGAGATGVLGLDDAIPDFVTAVERALQGRRPMALEQVYRLEQLLREHRAAEQRRWLPFDELTERERAIFALVYDGFSADQIADHECVSVNTVRSHIRRILTKLNVNSQLAAVALARTNDWFNPARI
jgi:DNA-binding NarL/FixJ family response regulator